MRLGGITAALATQYRALVEASGTRQVLELASGSGETSADLHARAGFRSPSGVMLIFSDLAPRQGHWAGIGERYSVAVQTVGEPVDATEVPAELGAGRVWLVVNAFHHLAFDQAAALLGRAAQSASGIFIAENFGANMLATLPCGVVGMLAAFLNPALTGRDRVSKAVFTYLIPLIPLVVAWDGLVSALRMHRPADVQSMIAPWPAWEWELREFKYLWLGRGTVLIGHPRV